MVVHRFDGVGVSFNFERERLPKPEQFQFHARMAVQFKLNRILIRLYTYVELVTFGHPRTGGSKLAASVNFL